LNASTVRRDAHPTTVIFRSLSSLEARSTCIVYTSSDLNGFFSVRYTCGPWAFSGQHIGKLQNAAAHDTFCRMEPYDIASSTCQHYQQRALAPSAQSNMMTPQPRRYQPTNSGTPSRFGSSSHLPHKYTKLQNTCKESKLALACRPCQAPAFHRNVPNLRVHGPGHTQDHRIEARR
jgi:hypothetical protein